ncbi:MAG: ABC transporter permease subunit [Gammaproteobacteria bacterium]|nr:ABC transporter permease subunit [Gammaproteobacteria bacterium]
MTVAADRLFVTVGRRMDRHRWIAPALLIFIAVTILARARYPWLVDYPTEWMPPIAAWLNVAIDRVIAPSQPFFRASAGALHVPMHYLQAGLQWLPWPAAVVIIGALALRAGGWRLLMFAMAVSAYLLASGYWRQSMNTLTLVLLAVPISVALGFAAGVAAQRLARLRSAIEAVLDVMQTMPSFAYLIPLLLLFGFGPVVGLIASALYAIPPMVRNTLLGLQEVPISIREAGSMAGASSWQKFFYVELPTAMPQILVGINQTTMAIFSMVIIAAIIGGFDDIGWEVLSAMRKAEFGQSVLSGSVIALLAMLIDRITSGFAEQRKSQARRSTPRRGRWVYLAAALLATALCALPHSFSAPPEAIALDPGGLNDALMAFVAHHAGLFEQIKNGFMYGGLLPLRIGLVGVATSQAWGFALTPTMTTGYVLAISGIAGVLYARGGRWAPSMVIIAAVIFYFGLADLPWPAFIAMVGTLAWRAAGRRVAAFAVASLVFILVCGLWQPFVHSMYLCALAVLLCVIVGGLLGASAARYKIVSATLRPINDALQTMPQFVFLIPALMLFKVGEFTALIAIMLYAIVPPIRYVEHGLRAVPPTLIEAGRQMGCTPRQLLYHVKLPLALPSILLGMNQTIMAALSMLAVAALVGTTDLGQRVYVALGKADAGLGLTAGLSIALVAMVSDRIVQGWCRRRGNVGVADDEM